MTGSFLVADHLRCLASASSDILTNTPFLVTAFWDKAPCGRELSIGVELFHIAESLWITRARFARQGENLLNPGSQP